MKKGQKGTKHWDLPFMIRAETCQRQIMLDQPTTTRALYRGRRKPFKRLRDAEVLESPTVFRIIRNWGHFERVSARWHEHADCHA